MSDDGMHTGNTGLFAVFALSIYSLFLFPYSCYSLCCRSDEQVVQPFLQVRPRTRGPRSGLLTCAARLVANHTSHGVYLR